MLPRIIPECTIEESYQTFLNELNQTSFSGEIRKDYATRLSMAVDNSIYQVIPQSVIFPRSTQDIVNILNLANQEQFRNIKFAPRGGGSGPNGQSLTNGIIIDFSKYMNEILELNLEEKWVRVQPGVVLDQLNDFLRLHELFFAPEISSSNRATIGGMVNTDACGIGSKVLGRTSDHVENLTCVFSDGRILQTANVDKKGIHYRKMLDLIEPHQALINEKFTSAPRTLNGYNLKKALDFNYLICGSEGTLAIVTECKLRLTPLPKFRKLLIVKYKNFIDALNTAEEILAKKPFAIESLDENLIELARQDPFYYTVKDFIENSEDVKTGAVSLVEFISQDQIEIEKLVTNFCKFLETKKQEPNQAIGYSIANSKNDENLLWELRKKSVGLISQKQDKTRHPIPFVEDTAVPPEKLANYIIEFKAILNKYSLVYGMYGHLDAGCVHVRPALDMKLIQDNRIMRELSNQIAGLVKKYNGVLWGEHGHGFRSLYGEAFFGETLYHVVRQIKTLFDPDNKLNPGKIATSLTNNEKLVRIDGPLRGEYDRQSPENFLEEYSKAMECNGNAACFNYATTQTMCPSYKVTKDRIHSPKGRATLMREWLRQIANKKVNLDIFARTNIFKKIINSLNRKDDFSNEVFAAMSGCLSCKACAGQCPLNVDVPEFKSKFLALYYQRYMRPLRDYFIGSLEKTVLLQARFSLVTNWLFQTILAKYLLKKIIKMLDPPLIGDLSYTKKLIKQKAFEFNINDLINLSAEKKAKSVVLLQDMFTSYYEPNILFTVYEFLTKVGCNVYIAPYFPCGKPWHVKGFMRRFRKVVENNNERLQEYAKFGIPIVGIDPSITLTYRDEYPKILKKETAKVQLLQEWLVLFLQMSREVQGRTMLSQINSPSLLTNENQYYLVSHCTEKTLCAEAEKQWQEIFKYFNLKLMILPSGCCGMAGSYGHEVEHVTNSQKLFAMDWQRYISEHSDTILATGYSCRSQAKRLMNINLKHPIEVINSIDCFELVRGKVEIKY